MRRLLPIVILVVGVAVASASQTPPQSGEPPATQGRGGRGARGMDRPQRDNQREAATGTASIAGRVIAADTSRPIKRARVFVTGGGRPVAAITDDQGRFAVNALPAATYNITATKSGFVDAAFGQRRTIRQGTPVTLADGQHLANVEIKLPRGGVITGRVGDEDGEPLARAVVTVLRYQYVRGERQLMPAGVDQTDDRGQYRIFGLAPGEYYVSATSGGPLEQMLRNVLEVNVAPPAENTQHSGYAPTYYPGVVTASEATRTKVAAGQEVGNVDFQVQLVPLATVKGVVASGPATVMLVPEGAGLGGGRGAGGRGGLGGLAELAGNFLRGNQSQRATTLGDGTFAIRNVAPGTYTVVARAMESDPNSRALRTAMQQIQVTGQEVFVSLTPAPAVTMSGTITLEATAGALPNGFSGFRVNPSPAGAVLALPGTRRPETPDARGAFTVSDLIPGRYFIRASGPRGWVMKAVYLDGRDVTDELVEVKGEPVSGVNVVFTDKMIAVAGTVRDARGAPAVNLQVIVFAADEKLWYAQSRHIQAARTDANGVYRLTGLPPGSYLVVATDDVEQGEWFDPSFLEQVKGSASTLTLGEGEQRALDLKTS